jgi:hypothetical protein
MADDARGSGGLGALVRLAIMLLLGGAVALPFAPPAASRVSPAADSKSEPASTKRNSESGSQSAPNRETHTDADTLLGQFVGLDVTDATLDAVKAGIVAALSGAALPGLDTDYLRVAPQEWRELGREELRFELARRATANRAATLDVSDARPDGVKTRIMAVLSSAALADLDTDYLRVAPQEWRELGREELRFELVRCALAHRGITPEFLIATVPDPINSNANWTFDPVISSIDRAAAASSFLLDRYYIPDWSPETDPPNDERPRLRHEKSPGIVLFRHAQFSGAEHSDRRVLVVALVFETPTAGIHQEAFAEAVRNASRWNRSDPIRVLGPTFSGSTTSLSNAIDAFPSTSFRVVTGSATSPGNSSLRRHEEDREVTFKSTVNPDDEVIKKLVEYLRSTGSTDRIALLVEADTSYGNRLAVDNWPDGTRVLPFPLHISRLRSAARSQPGNPAGGSSRLTGLPLGQAGVATDQLPAMTPGSTSSSVELELSNILDIITRDHIGTVGLLATDTRDKLFLAQELAHHGAAVRLFTIESDLFFVHPDYNQYVRGMIVASSYPIFAEGQRWANDSLSNEQFPTTMAEGVYNATIALLSYTHEGNPLTERQVPVLDYTIPGRGSGRPPIWISVVGNDALWPITWSEPNASEYVQHLNVANQADAAVAEVSSWSVLFVTLLGTVVALHTLFYRRQRSLESWGIDAWPFVRFFAPDDGFNRRLPYLFVVFSVLTVAWGYMWTLMMMKAMWIGPSRFKRFGELLAWVAASLLLGDLLLQMSRLVLAIWPRVWERFAGGSSRNYREVQYLLMVLALTSAAAAALSGGIYLVDTLLSRDTMVYYFARATHPANGVSPASPMLLIAALVYLWAFAHLRRLTGVSGAFVETSLRPFAVLVGPSIKPPIQKLHGFIDGAVQKLPRSLAAAVVIAVIANVYLVMFQPLDSPEPVSFAVAFRAALILLQILVLLAFAHVAYFWTKLRAAMHAFDGTPMIGAFTRLPSDFFHDRLSPSQPDDADVRRMSHAAAQLGLALEEMEHARDGRLATSLREVASGNSADSSGPLWTCNPQWTKISALVPPLVCKVGRRWRARARSTALETVDFNSETKDDDNVQRWYLRAEEFLAMYVLLIVRELLYRLSNVFFYIIVAVMVMVAIQQSFPFQPPQELLEITWFYVLGAVVLILTIFAQMEHDAVLSAFASTRAGALNWDVALWSKVFIYGVIPIATAVAAQFPSFGTTLLEWLTPVQKALP